MVTSTPVPRSSATWRSAALMYGLSPWKVFAMPKPAASIWFAATRVDQHEHGDPHTRPHHAAERCRMRTPSGVTATRRRAISGISTTRPASPTTAPAAASTAASATASLMRVAEEAQRGQPLVSAAGQQACGGAGQGGEREQQQDQREAGEQPVEPSGAGVVQLQGEEEVDSAGCGGRRGCGRRGRGSGVRSGRPRRRRG